MTPLLRGGLELLFGLTIWVAVSSYAQSQSLKEIQDEWANQISKSIVNPPERGPLPLEAFKALPSLDLPKPTFNRYLSLLVTDVDSVNEIKFSEVMDQLAKQSGNPSLTKETLFHQWWDTQNKHPGLGLGPHCDDVPPQDQLQQFVYDCPRAEGAQAAVADVFTAENAAPPNNAHAYSAIAFSNRFDLLAQPRNAGGGTVIYPDCGEYRIIFALNSGKTIASQSIDGKPVAEGDLFNRNLISFEFRIKNPAEKAEAADAPAPEGCIPILKFWYSLSETASGKQRGDLLKAFFMDGKMTAPDGQSFGQLPSKVVDIRNLAFDSGQIRTNQFENSVRPATPQHDYTPGTPAKVDPNNWMLREFRVLAVGHKVFIVPATTKSNPDVSLFMTGATDDRLPYLINNIRDQSKNLLGGEDFDHMGDINAITFRLTKSVTNGYQSVTGSPRPCNPPSTCNTSKVDDIMAAFARNVTLSTEIALAAPKGISADNIVDRLRTQTCAGCHQFSDTKLGSVGFDDPNTLGAGAHWPTKACGDYKQGCSLSSFIITDTTKLHPPLQFTQVSEAVLIPSAADNDKKHWRYAISSTVECMLDFREKLMGRVFNFTPSANNCPP